MEQLELDFGFNAAILQSELNFLLKKELEDSICSFDLKIDLIKTTIYCYVYHLDSMTEVKLGSSKTPITTKILKKYLKKIIDVALVLHIDSRFA